MTTGVQEDVVRHLAREDGQEDLCFALYGTSSGATRTCSAPTGHTDLHTRPPLHAVLRPVCGERRDPRTPRLLSPSGRGTGTALAIWPRVEPSLL